MAKLIFFWAQVIKFLFCDLRHRSLMGFGSGLVFHWWELLISQHLTAWICIFPTSLNSSHDVPAMDFVTGFVFLFVYTAKKKHVKARLKWGGVAWGVGRYTFISWKECCILKRNYCFLHSGIENICTAAQICSWVFGGEATAHLKPSFVR